MVLSDTELIYGYPKDSVNLNNPNHRPKYFMHTSREITVTYATFVGFYSTRSGRKFTVRNDFGYLRSLSLDFKVPNLETMQFYEFFLRDIRGRVIYPYWPAYMKITAAVGSSTQVYVASTQENIAVIDYVFLLKKDYSKYSIRGISQILDTEIILSEAPTDSNFGVGDFIIPAVVGQYTQKPRLTYSIDRNMGNLKFQLREHQVNGERLVIGQEGAPTTN